MKRTILLAISILLISIPGAVSAQALKPKDVIPELNPLCWTQLQCEQKRAEFGIAASDYANGFIQEAPCNVKNPDKSKNWGKCLPAGVSNTEIKFGGKTTFKDIGEFLITNYNYLIGIAGILAVIIIIAAGVQWTTSAGNSEAIGSAKKKIGGALVGMFIAFMSYTILNTINPALVNLRLPSVFMIKPANLIPKYCDQLKTKEPPLKFGLAAAPGVKDLFSPDTVKLELNLKSDQKKFTCGSQFYVDGGGMSTCEGTYCGEGNLCVPQENGVQCVPGLIGGKSLLKIGLGQIPAVDGNVKLMALCANGRAVEVADVDYNEQTDFFIIPREKSEAQLRLECNNRGPLVGFYLGVEVNDMEGGLGVIGAGIPGSYGGDDWFAIGQTSPGSRDCSVNLAIVAGEVLGKPAADNKQFSVDKSCAYLSIPTIAASAVLKPAFLKHLISIDELKDGYLCNLSITRTDFPALVNQSNDFPELSAFLLQGAGISSAVAGVAWASTLVISAPVLIPASIIAAGTAGVSLGISLLVNSVDDITDCTNFATVFDSQDFKNAANAWADNWFSTMLLENVGL